MTKIGGSIIKIDSKQVIKGGINYEESKKRYILNHCYSIDRVSLLF